jgi:ankyrin repeat protein
MSYGARIGTGQRDGPLDATLISGQVETAKILIEAGATMDTFAQHCALLSLDALGKEIATDPRVVNTAGPSGVPLTYALINHRRDVVELLLAHGADPNAAGELGTPIHMAVYAEDAKLVELLLAHGGRVDAPSGRDGGMTPLQLAARRESVELVRCLLQHGANPAAVDRNGNKAMDYGHSKVVKDLLRASTRK